MPPEGVIKTRVAFEQLVSRGIGDTLRVSLTLPNPRKHEEIVVGRQILADIAAGRFRSRARSSTTTRSTSSPARPARAWRTRRSSSWPRQVKEMTAYAERPRPHHRGDGLPRERPGRDRRRRPGPLVRPHPRQPQAQDGDGWAPSPTTRSCRACKQELDALIEARAAAARRALSRLAGLSRAGWTRLPVALHVRVDHQADQLLEADARRPAQLSRALVGSPSRMSTSAGRKYLGSTFT